MILVAIASAYMASAQQQAPEPMELLTQIRKKVADGIGRMPRYLCTEKVERRKVQLPSGINREVPCPELIEAFDVHAKRVQLVSSDRLRLDVAVINNHETYSWVNEGRFGDKSLSDLVRSGLTANGSFGSFLRAIFASDVATFAYVGEFQLEGRRTLQYSFSVPLSKSAYQISNAVLGRLVPYSGTFLVDPETLDLRKIEIHADDMPQALHFCRVSNEMTFAKLKIDNVDFMLPSAATTTVVNDSGARATNNLVFSSCHEFLGESKLLFDDPTPNSATAEAKQKQIDIPAGLTFLIALSQAIDPSTMAGGDPIKGFLNRAVELPELNTNIPKGTIVHGRIFALLMDYSEGADLRLSVKWESVDFGGAQQPLHLSLDGATTKTAKTYEILIRQSQPRFGEETDETIGNLEFVSVKRKYQIPVGFETRWLSLESHQVQNQ